MLFKYACEADCPPKFGDSRSNGFRDIRLADFVSNERRNIMKAVPIERDAFSPKKINRNQWSSAKKNTLNVSAI